MDESKITPSLSFFFLLLVSFQSVRIHTFRQFSSSTNSRPPMPFVLQARVIRSLCLFAKRRKKSRVNVYTTVGERAFRCLCVNHSARRRRQRRRRRKNQFRFSSQRWQTRPSLPFRRRIFSLCPVLFADSRSHRSDSSHRITVTTKENNKIKRKTNTRMLTSLESTVFSSLSSQFNLGLQHFVSSLSSSELF